jgi:hypothetical protein
MYGECYMMVSSIFVSIFLRDAQVIPHIRPNLTITITIT